MDFHSKEKTELKDFPKLRFLFPDSCCLLIMLLLNFAFGNTTFKHSKATVELFPPNMHVFPI